MSSIAHNSYIHAHLVDNTTGRVNQEELRVKAGELVATSDSLRTATKQVQNQQVLKNERVVLPPSNKKAKGQGEQDAYTELAEAFGAITVAMGHAMSDQANIFSEEQNGNAINTQSMFQAHTNQVKQQKKVADEIQQEEEQRAEEEKQAKIKEICDDVAFPAAVFGPILSLCIAPIVSKFSSTLGTAMSSALHTLFTAVTSAITGGSKASTGHSEAHSAAKKMTQTTSLSMDAFSKTTEMTEGAITRASSTITATTYDAASIVAKTTNQTSTKEKNRLKSLGKTALSVAFANLHVSSGFVQGTWNKYSEKPNSQFAEQQHKLGQTSANSGPLYGASCANQMEAKGASSILTCMSEQDKGITSSYADMMQTVRQNINAFAYAA